jgi:DNA polymerase-3 subunit alpha
VEITVFADLYRTNRALLESGEPLVIVGTREGDPATPKVLATEIHPLVEAPMRFGKGVRITISTLGTGPRHIKDLKEILSRHRGRVPVKLHLVIPNRTETVISLSSVACDASDAMVTEVHNAFGYQAVSFE